MNYRDLEDAGLTEIEAKIYLAALELGETSIARIAQKSKVKRTTIYPHIDSLRQKGLISTAKRGKKVTFYAEDPRRLDEVLANKKARLTQIMPELLTYVKLFDKKPEIKFFEGTEGIREVYKDTLKYPDTELCTWYSEAYSVHFDEKFFFDFYIPERKKLKILARAILPDNEAMRELAKNNQNQLRITKLVSAQFLHIGIELCVYGTDKILIASYEEKFAIIIESQVIHDSMKSIFETMWALAPEIKK